MPRRKKKLSKVVRHGGPQPKTFARQKIDRLSASVAKLYKERNRATRVMNAARLLLDAWHRRSPNPEVWLRKLDAAMHEVGGYEDGPGKQEVKSTYQAWKETPLNLAAEVENTVGSRSGESLKRWHEQQKSDVKALDGWVPYGDDDDWGLA